MAVKMFLVVVLLTILGNVCGDERADITSTYKESITELQHIYWKKFQETLNQTILLTNKITKNQEAVSKHIAQSITYLRNYTATEINKTNVKLSPNVLACVTKQDEIAASLKNPIEDINGTCYPTGLLNDVVLASVHFRRIYGLLAYTVQDCDYLNPIIPIQNDNLRICLKTKIAEAAQMIGEFTSNYNGLYNKTLTNNIQCTTKLLGDINEQIVKIRYQTRLCNSHFGNIYSRK